VSRAERSLPRWEGVAMLLATLGCWCAVPILVRHLAGYVDHWTNNGWRYGAAALVWLPGVLVAAGRGRLPRSIWRAALVPAAANTVAQVAFTSAHSHIDPGLLTFGLRMQLLAVAVGAYLLFPNERAMIRSPRYLAGLAFLVTGIGGVLLQGEMPLAGSSGLGVALAVGAGFGYGAYALAVRRFMHPYPPVLAFGVIALYTASALVAMMLAFGRNGGADVLQLGGRELAYMVVSSMLGIAIGHVLYYASIDRLGVAATTGVLQLQPFVVGGISAVVFGEAMTRLQWGSGAVAVLGAVLVLSAQKRTELSRRNAPRT
jgi:drug/metabolite transporter (DMT)-like permease